VAVASATAVARKQAAIAMGQWGEADRKAKINQLSGGVQWGCWGTALSKTVTAMRWHIGGGGRGCPKTC